MAWMHCTWPPRRVILTLSPSCWVGALTSTQLLKYVLYSPTLSWWAPHTHPPTNKQTNPHLLYTHGCLLSLLDYVWKSTKYKQYLSCLSSWWTLKELISDRADLWRKYNVQKVECWASQSMKLGHRLWVTSRDSCAAVLYDRAVERCNAAR